MHRRSYKVTFKPRDASARSILENFAGWKAKGKADSFTFCLVSIVEIYKMIVIFCSDAIFSHGKCDGCGDGFVKRKKNLSRRRSTLLKPEERFIECFKTKPKGFVCDPCHSKFRRFGREEDIRFVDQGFLCKNSQKWFFMSHTNHKYYASYPVNFTCFFFFNIFVFLVMI